LQATGGREAEVEGKGEGSRVEVEEVEEVEEASKKWEGLRSKGEEEGKGLEANGLVLNREEGGA
jgi:hypothetical protein